MWTSIRKIFGYQDTVSKLNDLKSYNETLVDIEKSLDILAEEFTIKNENRKSIVLDTILDADVKNAVESKFNIFAKSYNDSLKTILEDRRSIIQKKVKLEKDNEVIRYFESRNNIKKAFLDGQIDHDIFLDIMDKEKNIFDVMPMIEKASNKQQRKVATVMDEYKSGELASSSGEKVTNRDQAIAIAMSEAGIKKNVVTQNKSMNKYVEKADMQLTLEGVAKKHSVAPEVVQRELQLGLKREMEHTDNKAEARKIALEHLSEVHDYYTRLVDMYGDHEREMQKGDDTSKESGKEVTDPSDNNEMVKSDCEEKENDKEGKAEEKEDLKKADYYHPKDAAVVDGDKKEEDRDFLKGYMLVGYNINASNEIDMLDFIHYPDVDIQKAEYDGNQVSLGQPMAGDVKKFKVYVKNAAGKVVKVNFGDPNMEIKRDNPERKRSFRARHQCDAKKDRTTPGYWSCKMWSKKPVSEITKALDMMLLEGDIYAEQYSQLIQKAKSGVYADNEYNRKLGRVGEKYGADDEDEEKKTKPQAAEKDDPKPKEEKQDKPGRAPKEEDVKEEPPKVIDIKGDKHKKLRDMARQASAQNLQVAIKQSNDPELRSIAQEELNRRKEEEVATKAI